MIKERLIEWIRTTTPEAQTRLLAVATVRWLSEYPQDYDEDAGKLATPEMVRETRDAILAAHFAPSLLASLTDERVLLLAQAVLAAELALPVEIPAGACPDILPVPPRCPTLPAEQRPKRARRTKLDLCKEKVGLIVRGLGDLDTINIPDLVVETDYAADLLLRALQALEADGVTSDLGGGEWGKVTAQAAPVQPADDDKQLTVPGA
jgi:hypothetical protein